jgi:hypothetical protein
MGLTCPNITSLTLDPTYFIEPAFQLYCPALQHMELVGFEHMVVWDFAPLLERSVSGDAKCKLRKTFTSMRSITITGDGTLRNLDKDNAVPACCDSVRFTRVSRAMYKRDSAGESAGHDDCG